MPNIYKTIPDGWKILHGAATYTRDYVWVSNGKSRFSGEYKSGLVKRENAASD